jgi:hypothetical protein
VTETEINWRELAARLIGLAYASELGEELPRLHIEERADALDSEENHGLEIEFSVDLLMEILKRYHTRQPSWAWDEGMALQSIDEWKEAIPRAPGCRQTIAPLGGFEGPNEAIAIRDGLTIRPFTDAERDAIWRDFGVEEQPSRPGLPNAENLEGWSHVIDCRWQLPAGPDFLNHEPGVECVRDVVRALRLHRPGAVGIPLAWTRPDPPSDPDGGGYQAGLFTPEDADHFDVDPFYTAGRKIPAKVKVEPDDGNALAALLEGMHANQGNRRLALALRRFDSAYSRYQAEDSLIDLWIAFEALLLPDVRTELSFRAAVRIAQLAGSETSGRRVAFEQAHRSYNLRSQVVHGGDASDDLDVVVEQTRELARKVLRACVLKPRVLKPKEMKKIDLSLFGDKSE